jgi:putative transposase
VINGLEEVDGKVEITAVCKAIGIKRATFYRRRRPQSADGAGGPRPTPRRALSGEERREVLEVLDSERFADTAPEEVHATLLDEGRYLCAPRTMYRILSDNDQVRERRNQRIHPPQNKPELVATAPNRLWSWDVTKLKGPAKWSLFYLYVILDVFSRYAVGWMVATKETAELAKRLISETIAKYDVDPRGLDIHADRGSAQRAKLVVQLYADLGIVRSHGRPHTPNDNPFSESQFKTMKYRPEFPSFFSHIEDAKVFCSKFFNWYNHEHRHGGIGFLTPHDVHFGLAEAKLEARRQVLIEAYLRNPERFVKGIPTPTKLPAQVWINGPGKGVITP